MGLLTKRLNKEYVEKLDGTLKKIDRAYRSLNRGGCGIFAHTLGSLLEKEGYKVKYYIELCSKYDVSVVKKNRNDAETLINTSWEHVVLKVSGKVIDSTGITTKFKESYRYYVEIPKEILEEWLEPQYQYQWNRQFDRNLMVEIAKKLYSDLGMTKEVKKLTKKTIYGINFN